MQSQSSDVIACRGLTKWYGRARGIENVSFTVEAGELFGFIGPNGAGKSTTIRTLLGLIRANRGEARLFGRPIVFGDPTPLLDVGYVPAEVNYYPEMRVGELLDYAAGFYPNRSSKRQAALAKRFGLDLGRRIGSLSLGNKKKVALVQALQHHPRLLILDEPSSGLDPLVQQEFYALMQEEHAEGTTIFFSSHQLDEVQRLCKRVAIIRAGRLLAVEAIDALRAGRVRRVTLRSAAEGAGGRPPGPARLTGVGNVERREDGSLTFLYEGEIKPLLRALAETDASDVTIAQPSLEEIVLRYYEEGETNGRRKPEHTPVIR